MNEDFKNIKIEDTVHSLENLPMSALMDLNLEDLRDLDKKVGQFDKEHQQIRWQEYFLRNKFPHFFTSCFECSFVIVSDLFSCQIIKSRNLLVLVARLVLTHDNMASQMTLNKIQTWVTHPSHSVFILPPHSTLDHLQETSLPSGNFSLRIRGTFGQEERGSFINQGDLVLKPGFVM